MIGAAALVVALLSAAAVSALLGAAAVVLLLGAVAVSALLRLFSRLAAASSCASRSDTFRSCVVNCSISSLLSMGLRNVGCVRNVYFLSKQCCFP